MASKELLKQYEIAIQALAEKYDVPRSKIVTILDRIPNEKLGIMDWKDLDLTIEQGLNK